jgi:hypothetical protein
LFNQYLLVGICLCCGKKPASNISPNSTLHGRSPQNTILIVPQANDFSAISSFVKLWNVAPNQRFGTSIHDFADNDYQINSKKLLEPKTNRLWRILGEN